MTSKREELIEEVHYLIEQADSFRLQVGGDGAGASPTSLVGLWMRTASALKAVFEQSRTPCEASSNDEQIERALDYIENGTMPAERREWLRVLARRPVQVEPTDAPTVQFMARKGGKVQALIDSLLAQANERGIHIEVVYPQGEPTDTDLLAASNAYMHYRPPYDDLSAFSVEFLEDMRAALRAAFVAEQGENRG